MPSSVSKDAAVLASPSLQASAKAIVSLMIASSSNGVSISGPTSSFNNVSPLINQDFPKAKMSMASSQNTGLYPRLLITSGLPAPATCPCTSAGHRKSPHGCYDWTPHHRRGKAGTCQPGD